MNDVFTPFVDFLWFLYPFTVAYFFWPFRGLKRLADTSIDGWIQ